MLRIAGALAATLLALAPLPAGAADTVYVMRHLQKGQGDDPSLTPQGASGAAEVAALLARAPIAAVFATATRRAQETGGPLAAKRGLVVTTYDPREPQKLAAAVARTSGAVLVVGHSNTVPELVALFGGERPAALGDDDYGTIYVVTTGSAKVAQMHLGQAR
jgi:broad specificity phosphatase PhoE